MFSGRTMARASALFSELVEREVEFLHIDMWLAQYAEDTASRVVFDETAELVLWQATRLGDPRNLEQSGGRRDIGIEPARRGGDEIDRNLGGRIRHRQRRGLVLYPVDKPFRRWAIIRTLELLAL
jgi:hypothetical protein